jgi:hypothetical protein
MKIYALLLTLLMAGCSGCASVPDYAAAKPATVRLEFPGGTCSGTAVERYAILTARHCITAYAGEIRVSGVMAAYVVLADDGNDHVLLRVTAKQGRIAKLGPKPEQGAVVFVHGNPSSYPDILRVGHVAGWHEGDMLIDCNNWYGDSGAAVFDADGRIVGTVNSMFPWPNQGWRLTRINAMRFTPAQWGLIKS